MPCLSGEPPQIDRLFPPGLERGTTAEIKLVGKSGDAPLHVWTDVDGIAFQFSEDRTTATVACSDDVSPGLHQVRLYNEFGATDLLPVMIGVIPEIADEEPNNDPASAQRIELPSVTINGVLEKNEEVDLFAVSLTAGQTFIASVQAHQELGSPMDSVLQLLDALGTVIAHNDDDHGLDPQIVFHVPSDGQYFVRTIAFPSEPNSSIQLAGGENYVYRLTLTTAGFVDYVSPAIVDQRIENQISLHGWNLPAQTASLSSFESKAKFAAAGVVNVARISGVSHDCFSEDQLTDTPLPKTFSVTGCLSQPGEEDVYQITGEKGQKASVSVIARALNSSLDPVCVISDATAKVIKETDDQDRENLDVQTEIQWGEGIHTFKITDRYGFGGERFFYVLTCQPVQPEFSATVNVNSIVIPDDKPFELPVSIDRQHGFSEKITVSIEGLPEGVTCDGVDSLKEGETAKTVTLKLIRSDAAAAFTGPIRIHCQPEVGPAQYVKFSIKYSVDQTDQFWLTLPPVLQSTDQTK